MVNVFNFFKRKATLIAKTKTPNLVEVFPVVSAKDCLPSWYKDTPLTVTKGMCPVQHSITDKAATMKACAGINNLLRTGFILRAWEDISIVVYPDGRVTAVGTSTNPAIETHDKKQLPGCLQHYVVIKLRSPWFLYGDDTEYLFAPAPYHSALPRKYFVPSGIVKYKMQHVTNVFIAAEAAHEPYEIFIPAGQPLVHIIPLSNKDVEIRNVYDKDLNPFIPAAFFMLHGYSRYINGIKKGVLRRKRK